MVFAQGSRPGSSRVWALLVVLALAVSGTILGTANDAWAKDYPSWSQVEKARKSEAAKKAQIAKLEALLKQLEVTVAKTQAVAQEKGELFYEAQLAYDEAAYKAEQLQTQADEAQLIADSSIRQAGQIIARTQRAGGQNVPVQLFFNESANENLLSQLGMATKVSQQASGIFTKAKRDQNTAQSLTDQANVAKAALEELALAAEVAMVEAQSAADAAAAALEEQEAHQATLKAQLATLVTNRRVTEAEYKKGVEAAWGAGAGQAGPISDSGWTRPSIGYASPNSFGPRVPPTNGASSWHMGVDIGAPCNAGIYAAHAGTVVYAGWYGGYGNFVKVDHGNGITTSYGHMVNGGIKVRVGQSVGPGMKIGVVGTTGVSTGCHLHFEVRVHGVAKNPVYYLRNEGVNI
jgi:murein DD-endopeptidase MepM/ murein hydrolase activator NlpD